MKWIITRFNGCLFSALLIMFGHIWACDDVSLGDGALDDETGSTDSGDVNVEEGMLGAESGKLASYFEENDDLIVYMNDVVNLQKPLFFCFYDDQTNTSLNAQPIGKFGSSGGIPFGEFSAVQVPGYSWQSGDDLSTIAYVLTSNKDITCPANKSDVADNADFVTAKATVQMGALSKNHAGQSTYFSARGYTDIEYPEAEDWGYICGPEEDAFCEDVQAFSFASVELRSKAISEDKTQLNFVLETWGGYTSEMAICWDADGDGPESPVLLSELNIGGPQTGVFNPITSGVLLLYLDMLNCEDVGVDDAAAKLEIPAPMTFGPEGGEIEFGAGTQGSILIQGTTLDNAPPDAGPRIVPLLHW